MSSQRQRFLPCGVAVGEGDGLVLDVGDGAGLGLVLEDGDGAGLAVLVPDTASIAAPASIRP